jgi:hypothetical protein
MSDSSDTSTIDDKNEDSTTTIDGANLGKFIYTITILFIMIIFYYTSSGLLLYACKLGQSNILPTNIHCFPYNEAKINIQPIETNIFTTFTDPPLSMKMNFPYDKFNAGNKILDLFRNYKNESKSNFLANYFISIMEEVILFNYSSFNTILNGLNGLPEIFIVLFGPIIVSFLYIFIFIADLLYLIYLWFAKMSWFFKKNTNNTNTGKPNWVDVSLIDLFNFNYFIAVCLVILFIILFFFSLPLLNIVASLSILWCLISCITYKAQMNDKGITSLTIIQDLFKYYKVLIMSIFSFLVISTAFSTLGTVQGLFSIAALILIYFGFIGINIFKPINRENLTPIVSFEQAKKTCSYVEPTKDKHGLLYHLLFGQKGGNITKELKNISKKLSEK